jgi:hypothetical protein
LELDTKIPFPNGVPVTVNIEKELFGMPTFVIVVIGNIPHTLLRDNVY